MMDKIAPDFSKGSWVARMIRKRLLDTGSPEGLEAHQLSQKLP